MMPKSHVVDGWRCYHLTKVDDVWLATQIWKIYGIFNLGFAEIVENVRWIGFRCYHQEIEMDRWRHDTAASR